MNRVRFVATGSLNGTLRLPSSNQAGDASTASLDVALRSVTLGLGPSKPYTVLDNRSPGGGVQRWVPLIPRAGIDARDF